MSGDERALWLWEQMGGTADGWHQATDDHREGYRVLAARADEQHGPARETYTAQEFAVEALAWLVEQTHGVDEAGAKLLIAGVRDAWAERDRLREALAAAREELVRWGWGDYHYGTTPQEQSVVDAVAAIDAALGADHG